jgi:hypothetical protein
MSIPWAALEFDSGKRRWGLVKFHVLGIPISTARRVVAPELALRETIAASESAPA